MKNKFGRMRTIASLGISVGWILSSSIQAMASQPIRSSARPSHIVVVIEENHAYSEIHGNASAPYIKHLMAIGANFTNYHGVEHPSEPNYLDLFSGSNQGVTDDSSPHTFSTPNLASELLAKRLSFRGYSEGLPSVGYLGVTNTTFTYARKHNPWVNFTNVPSSSNLPLRQFPTNFNQLPTVSFVIPNLNDDMHDGSIQKGDTWLKRNLSSYASWCVKHNSLLIVTWDEDDNSSSNQVPLIMVGGRVRRGNYRQTLNHFNLLRTLEAFYGLRFLGASANAAPMTSVWK